MEHPTTMRMDHTRNGLYHVADGISVPFLQIHSDITQTLNIYTWHYHVSGT